jgi:hypothetical protein
MVLLVITSMFAEITKEKNGMHWGLNPFNTLSKKKKVFDFYNQLLQVNCCEDDKVERHGDADFRWQQINNFKIDIY